MTDALVLVYAAEWRRATLGMIIEELIPHCISAVVCGRVCVSASVVQSEHSASWCVDPFGHGRLEVDLNYRRSLPTMDKGRAKDDSVP